MTIDGIIKKIDEVQTFANDFKKRELVVTTQEQYPQDILVEFIQDRVELLNPFKVGNNVSISINIRGREWVNPEGITKHFNAIHGWRIENKEGKAEVPPVEGFSNANYVDIEDDLPF